MARASAPPTASRASSEDAMAKTMAPTPEMMAQVRAASQARPAVPIQQPAVQKPSIEPYKPDTLVDGKAGPAKFGSLVGVNRDGSDGDTIELTGDAFDIGRTEGSLNFGDDPYLAARHARLLPSGGKVTLRPLDTVNGVYLRVHGACDLGPGDQFLVGKELLRFEPCAPEERDPPSLVEHGVRLFGSAPREAWGRLRQLTVAGTTRDVWHLVRPELVLGREEGDVTFPDDEFMSRRHAAVKKVGPKAKLEDLGSSNGTFVRIRADRELKPGDVLRMGDQLLRFEL
jgi:pSer/pThr/pTyr-binding forkhead associated (FHA) protein